MVVKISVLLKDSTLEPDYIIALNEIFLTARYGWQELA